LKKTSPSSSSKGSKPEQFLYLTTTGRKTGRPREIEIWFTEHSGRYFVIAEYDTSQWVQNVRASADVRVRVGSSSFAARARVLTAEPDPELIAAVQQLSREKYGWGEGTVVELTPVLE
jgi:deazaflavin-dependent oxidoreductase (nitroreductase family)